MADYSKAPRDASRVERMWWNGKQQRSSECAYVLLGTLGDGWYFVQHTGTARWAPFQWRDDALAVAQRIAREWTPLVVAHPLPSKVPLPV